MSNPFTQGEPLFTTNCKGEIVKCEYVRLMRGDVHVVHVLEGEYQGSNWKNTDELYREKPQTDGI